MKIIWNTIVFCLPINSTVFLPFIPSRNQTLQPKTLFAENMFGAKNFFGANRCKNIFGAKKLFGANTCKKCVCLPISNTAKLVFDVNVCFDVNIFVVHVEMFLTSNKSLLTSKAFSTSSICLSCQKVCHVNFDKEIVLDVKTF